MIEIDHLGKNFGRIHAVKDLSFSVQTGEVLGVLGPNGAGKTTTMRMITGFITPSRGRVMVGGHNIERAPRAAQRLMGYLPEGAPAYGDMSTAQFLNFVANIRGLVGRYKRERLATMVAELELEPVLHCAIETLSKGFKRRVGLAQALIHDPRLLVLDEPTDGLDPNQKQQVRELIRRIANDKVILVSTHILEEVSAVCTRAIIISDGRLVADGSPRDLASQSRYSGAIAVAVSLPRSLPDGEQGAEQVKEQVKEKLRALAGVDRVEVDPEQEGRFIVFSQSREDLASSVLALIHDHGWRLLELQVLTGHLDEVFRRLTRVDEAVLH